MVEQGGGNHGISLSGNACLDKYLVKYLTDGTVPRGHGTADAVCKKTADPVPSAPQSAKAALSGTSAPAPAVSGGTTLHGILGFRG